MSPRAKLAVIGAVVISIAAGLTILVNLDIPAPSQSVEKTLDDDRFPS